MFAVPEVDDDIDVYIPIGTAKPNTKPEATKESLPSSSSPPPVSSVEKVEKNLTQMQNPPPPPPPPPPPVSVKQHRSRRSLFHRNTIHVCDQIVDRV